MWTFITSLPLTPADNVSLNMDGLLNVSNHSQNLVAVVCRVIFIHNSPYRFSRFYLNDTALDGISTVEVDQPVHWEAFDSCFMPPQSPQQCEELTLVLRATAAINNTEITCRSRSDNINDTRVNEVTSKETVTIIVKDAGIYTHNHIHILL